MKRLLPMGYGLVLIALYYFLPIEHRGLWQPDELRYAEISREMLATGDWWVPHFFELRYFEKPIAGYWINSLGQLIFGQSNFAVRAGAIFATLGSAGLVGWLAQQLMPQRRQAWIATLIFLTSLLVYGVGSYAVLDPQLMFWLVAAMCCHWRIFTAKTTSERVTGYLLLGASCAMGLMTKGFIALAVVAVAVLPLILLKRHWRQLLSFGPLALASLTLLCAPWAWQIHRLEPDFWHYFFWVEHIQRFAAEDAQHKSPFWFYLPILCLGLLPWLGWLPGSLHYAWQQRRDPKILFCLSWFLMPLLLLSCAKGKLLTYILPCYAPLSLLIAYFALNSCEASHKSGRLNSWINTLFGFTVALGVFLLAGPWNEPPWALYTRSEWWKWLFIIMAFMSWGVLGSLNCRVKAYRFEITAVCPLMFALVVGLVIPQRISLHKQPQGFVQQIKPTLANSATIVVNNPGLASAVAWELKRSDIWLFQQRGEMEYGLSYGDVRRPFIDSSEFASWLTQHRQQGEVGLVMMLNKTDSESQIRLPKPDNSYRQGRLLYYHYKPLP